MKPTLTPSMLEAWSLFVAEIITMEDTVKRLMRVKVPPNDKQNIGIGYHNLIQRGTSSYAGFFFDMKSASRMGLNRLGEMEYEVPFKKEYSDFKLSGRVDGLGMDMVHEFKTSDRAKDYKDYYLSPQWVCYAEAFGLPVKYHLIRYERDGARIDTVGLSQFEFSPRNDGSIERLSSEILRFANLNGISIA